MELVLETAEHTRTVGTKLARLLRPGDLLVLTGPLGAGKTALTQGIGAGLRIRGAVTSPTFVIARVHPPDVSAGGSVPLVHVDAYRLGGAVEVDDLDLDAELEQSVTVVEWGEGVAEQLAESYLQISLALISDDPNLEGTEMPRRAIFRGVGGDWSDRLAQLLKSD